jgi:hypothetical protein
VGVREPKPDHNLWDLWRCCKNVILAITGEADLAAVESLIEQFHKLDKFAIAFRYSSNKKGALITLPDVHVDMQKLRDVMEGLDHFFQGADGQLDEYTSFAAWETQGLAT